MGNIFVSDIGFVSRIVEDDALVAQGEVDPLAQLVFRQHRTRRVVGVAEVDHVYAVVGQLGSEVVLGRTGEVSHAAPAAVLKHAGAANHRV